MSKETTQSKVKKILDETFIKISPETGDFCLRGICKNYPSQKPKFEEMKIGDFICVSRLKVASGKLESTKGNEINNIAVVKNVDKKFSKVELQYINPSHPSQLRLLDDKPFTVWKQELTNERISDIDYTYRKAELPVVYNHTASLNFDILNCDPRGANAYEALQALKEKIAYLEQSILLEQNIKHTDSVFNTYDSYEVDIEENQFKVNNDEPNEQQNNDAYWQTMSL